ncbi:DUF3300 domain-containing protein [Paraburkholderia haematera]|uniref:DUF3300 domain-containing protein n=1 Tax=Paraburkholderia haematera TaxID=2793077 RepID=A0ABM8SD76_9BURK|nr:DUF3300 domain-containing protein [Paraburkholderia haematera]CAE6801923.1 hypothetical protein R69888_05250 [Paraburkholderia haematera]
MKPGSMKRMTRAVVSVCMISMLGTTAVLIAPQPVHAQTVAVSSGWTDQQIDALSAPIALYPDALLSQVLMASTYPAEVDQAAAWVRTHTATGDSAVRAVASQPWDPSVQSLVAFPTVLTMMGAKPDWVHQLGEAFLARPDAVMDSVQRLRAKAHAAGNLNSTSQQKVVVQQGTSGQIIVIQPSNPQVVYVPTYNPTVVYGVWPYPAYPPVYLPPPPGYAFASGVAAGIGFGVGVAVTYALWGNCDWNHHDVNINVNHYNHINVNHQITTTTNHTTWRHDTTRRTATSWGGGLRDTQGRPREGVGPVMNRPSGALHGNDAARNRAQQVLGARTGNTVDGNALQRLQGMHDTRPVSRHTYGAGGAGMQNRTVAQRGALEPGPARTGPTVADRNSLSHGGVNSLRSGQQGQLRDTAVGTPETGARGAASHGRGNSSFFRGLAEHSMFRRG